MFLTFVAYAAQLQSSTPLAQPPPDELAEMTHRAQEVVRLLESLRSPSAGKLANSSTASSSSTLAPASASHSSVTSSAFGDRTNSHTVLNSSGPLGGAPIDLDTRAPKRPWEETQTSSTLPHVSQLHLSNSPVGAGQGGGQTAAERSAAEKDMEIIRTKRALTTSLAAAAAAAGGSGSVAGAVGGAVGAGKSKYRKRSVSLFFWCFHGFEDITERTCNTSARHHLASVTRVISEKRQSGGEVRMVPGRCVMPVAFVGIVCHPMTTCVQPRFFVTDYAKLVRKRDKALAAEGGSGTVMRIDMDMLRASARAAESEKAARAAANGTNPVGGSGSSSNGSGELDKMSVHTSSFQIVPMNMNMDSESGSGQGQQGPLQTQTQTQTQSQQPQAQTSQPSTQHPPPPVSSGTPHLHPHGVGSGQGHPLPAHGPPSQGNTHYSHPQSQTRTHPGPPPPPWAGKAYGQEMQHQQQSFIRTSHSVSSGASPH
ncbi:hypothetical protein J3R83DRAFT_12594 [Lanmaoa asiatica]|nr:hypothetical protein J3R83DRAFT_12594 [Lanmaoa asiatica]